MDISANGINLIKKFEGCVLQVYLDAVKVKTLGYGHTGADVNAMPVGARISQEQADYYLSKDLEKFEMKVDWYNPVYKWTQNEFDALVSFAYNVGNIDQLTANGSRTKEQIASKMLEYNKAGGKVLAGLTNRRKVEHDLFVNGAVPERTYIIGKTYIIDTNLYIREEPYGNKKKHGTITPDAQRKAYFDSEGYAVLKEGTKVTCKGIRKVDNSTWLLIPSGWICAREGEKVYIHE